MSSISRILIYIPFIRDIDTYQRFLSALDDILKDAGISGEIITGSGHEEGITGDDLRSCEIRHERITFSRDKSGIIPSRRMTANMQHAGTTLIIHFHPDCLSEPGIIRSFIDECRAGADIVIACKRTARGGWGREISFVRRCMQLPWKVLWSTLLPGVSDPWSRCFAVHENVVREIPSGGTHSNILIEILGKGDWGSIAEIPCECGSDAKDGAVPQTGLHMPGCTDQLREFFSILLYAIRHRNTAVWREWLQILKFASVGISGIFVEIGLLYALTEWAGIYYLISAAVAIEVSIINNFIWNEHWTFRSIKRHRMTRKIHRFLSYQAVTMGGLVITVGVLYALTEWAGIYYILSDIAGIFTAFAWNYIINRHFTWGGDRHPP